MNDTPVFSRQSLLDTLRQLSHEFDTAKADVQQREAILHSALQVLSDSLSISVADTATARLARDNPLIQAARNVDDKIAARLLEWRRRVEKYERNTEFRQDFGDSLLVFVYGKVKAGKSSLGNHVAYGHSNPSPDTVDDARRKGLAPLYFLKATAGGNAAEDSRAKLEREGKFAVGALETTSAIQGFRLPGLTWIDSPGLHSVTEANGELAKRYAEAADLIIYPMNSGQPGRASDFDEIAQLLRARKPFLGLITRCDTTDIDEDDEGNIIKTLMMKSDRDRNDQIRYVRGEMIAKAQAESRQLLDESVLTVSVAYAESRPDDPQALLDSGLSSLFEKLTALTRDQGVRLKKSTPINNLRAFSDQILEGELSTQSLRDDLALLQQGIAQQRNSLNNKQQAITGYVLRDLDPALREAVRQYGRERNSHRLSQRCQEITRDIVIRHIVSGLSEVLKDAESTIDQAIRFDEFTAIPEFRDITQEIRHSNKRRRQTVGSGIGAVTGGLLGWLAGPIGSAVGSMVGGYIGAKLGAASTGDTITTVTVGNNLQEVMMETGEIACAAARQKINEAFRQFDREFLAPVETTACRLIDALQHFETTLKNEVRP